MFVVTHRITVRLCQVVVAREFEMTREQLLAKTRRQAVSHPRQIAMYLATQLTEASLPDIGDRFGGFDHTTVMYARDRVAARMAEDEELRRLVEQLAHRISRADPAEVTS